DTLQLRLHPAASRIALLAEQHPATFMAFDLLADEKGAPLLKRPFADRRNALAQLFKRIGKQKRLILSRATTSRTAALKWLKDAGQGLEGHAGEAPRPAVPAWPPRHAEIQGVEDGRLRGRRPLPAARHHERDRVPAAWAV